jgi:hypothetical protein
MPNNSQSDNHATAFGCKSGHRINLKVSFKSRANEVDARIAGK